ncbi:MAG: hypothetical protein BWK78_02825 [Thiotrichaceae bacterium IS1]|nr:MAG: hypothetical protein BWK78_02825 [Thiotrichaceae bacterium IS1]
MNMCENITLQGGNAIEKQISVLRMLIDLPEEHESFLQNPDCYCQNRGVVLSPTVVNMLTNVALFDDRVWDKVDKTSWTMDMKESAIPPEVINIVNSGVMDDIANFASGFLAGMAGRSYTERL